MPVELLAPAGSAPAMVAAVQCGADAVYLGAGAFNARKSAENFGGELEAAVMYCHARGTKVHVALNTMVRQDELGLLEDTIGEIASSGADAVIVQDIGVARALKHMVPSLTLHASTQLAAHNPQAVEFLAEQGFSRVVLAREMDFEEIARCKGRGAELEVFIHGALCVACSGQCLLSSMIGGRSGNRGMCAQPCRMRYSMDAHEGYLLSTKDLCTLDTLPALLQTGVDSLKIEGRLKRAEYVAVTISAYRAALDAYAQGKSMDNTAAREELKQMFNRGGFTRGYGPGVDDQELMFHFRPNHLGVALGTCKRDGEIELTKSTDAGDALVLRRAGQEDIAVHPGALTAPRARLGEARRGDQLIRLVSKQQMLSAQAAFSSERRKFPISAKLILRVSKPSQLELSDGAHTITCTGASVEAAKARPADPERIRSQLEKLGDTPFVMADYCAQIDENAYLPISALNALRRLAVELLIQARASISHPCSPMPCESLPKPTYSAPELLVQSGNAPLLRRALEAGAQHAVYAPEDLRLPALNAALDELPECFDLALPPVMHGKVLEKLNEWANAHANRIRRTLISNISQMALRWPGTLCADYAMNIANELSIAQLRDWGIENYTPSIELNRAQLLALGGHKELIVYGALPLMQLRHCPLRACLGTKGKHRDCRRCDACAREDHINHKSLSDRTGASFPLRRIATDAGCVLQLLNSARLMPLRRFAALPPCESWRLVMDENDPVEALVQLYDMARKGQDPREHAAWQLVEEMNTTNGHFFRGAE